MTIDKLQVIRMMVSSKIRSLRIAKGWTQAWLAGEIEVDPAYISAIESAKRTPSIKTLSKLAEAFDIKFYELFIEDEDFKKSKVKNRRIFDILKDSSPEKVNKIYRAIKILHSK